MGSLTKKKPRNFTIAVYHPDNEKERMVKEVEGFELKEQIGGFRWFLYQYDTDIDGPQWVITEFSSGHRAEISPTKTGCVLRVKAVLSEIGPEKFKAAIEKAIAGREPLNV